MEMKKEMKMKKMKKIKKILPCDRTYLVIKVREVRIVKEVKRNDSL